MKTKQKSLNRTSGTSNIDLRGLELGLPQRYLDDTYLQEAIQKSNLQGVPAWILNVYNNNMGQRPEGTIGNDLFHLLVAEEESANLANPQIIDVIPEALEVLKDRIYGPDLNPSEILSTDDADSDLNHVMAWLPESSRMKLASEVSNGLTRDELIKEIKDSYDAYDLDDVTPRNMYTEGVATEISNLYGLDSSLPLYSSNLPVDVIQGLMDLNGTGPGQTNEWLKRLYSSDVDPSVPGEDILSQLIGNKSLDKPLPPGSPILSRSDKFPVIGWNVDEYDSIQLPISKGGTVTMEPKSNKLKDFFKKAKGNVSDFWNNDVKPTVDYRWNEQIKPAASNAWQYMKAHPGMSAGLGITGAANIAGLLDNDKVGGQLLGAGLGAGLGYGLIPKIGAYISPQAQLLTTLAGGSLGALFDNLRSKKEKEREQQRYTYR